MCWKASERSLNAIYFFLILFKVSADFGFKVWQVPALSGAAALETESITGPFFGTRQSEWGGGGRREERKRGGE